MRVVKKILKKKGKESPRHPISPTRHHTPKTTPVRGKKARVQPRSVPVNGRATVRDAPQATPQVPPETALYPRLHAELRAPLTPVQGNPTGTSVTPKPFLLCLSVSRRHVKRVDTTGGLRPGGVKPVEATVMMVDAGCR